MTASNTAHDDVKCNLMMPIKFAIRSEIGHVRKNNEDNFYCNGVFMRTPEKPFFMTGVAESPCVFAVCDGMGGLDCGELASLTAVETLAEYAPKFSQDEYQEVNNYVSAVNKRIKQRINGEEHRECGTTLALVNIVENAFVTYHLGDSRIYRTQNGKLLRITEDHTLAEYKVRIGIMTPQQAEKSEEWHILTKCLGLVDDDDTIFTIPDFNGAYPLKGRILICSDGVTDMLSDTEIEEIIIKAEDPAEAVNGLIDLALKKGGYDNATCVVIEKASFDER